MDNVVSLMISTPCKLTKEVKTGKERDTHRGKIVEYIARRHPLGLRDISRKVGVSRRTLYNWFEKEDLGMSDIMKIGFAIGYNFSNEFPLVAYANGLSNLKDPEKEALHTDSRQQAIHYWMEKYIRLLEQYNEISNCKMDTPES